MIQIHMHIIYCHQINPAENTSIHIKVARDRCDFLIIGIVHTDIQCVVSFFYLIRNIITEGSIPSLMGISCFLSIYIYSSLCIRTRKLYIDPFCQHGFCDIHIPVIPVFGSFIVTAAIFTICSIPCVGNRHICPIGIICFKSGILTQIFPAKFPCSIQFLCICTISSTGSLNPVVFFFLIACVWCWSCLTARSLCR